MNVLMIATVEVSYKNLFTYGENNPVMNKDTTGMIVETVIDALSLWGSIQDVCNNPNDPIAWACLAADARKNRKRIEVVVENFTDLGKGRKPFKAPDINVNTKGELTNGLYTLNQSDMLVHVDGKNPLKSQFLYDVDANKAKIYVENGPAGITGNGDLTDYINVYRTKTGYVHGCPGNP